jgi:hypothetical protein
MENEVTKNAYVAFRYIEGICIAVFVFGFLWEGTEILKLSLPEFMMLYGGVGAILSEGLARLFHKLLKKKEPKKVKKEATPSGSQ